MTPGLAAPPARVHSDWDRDASDDDWMLGDCEEDPNMDPTGQAHARTSRTPNLKGQGPASESSVDVVEPTSHPNEPSE